MALCASFPPIINTESRVLILGSMPGGVSLQKQQYYAHPNNKFWTIIFSVLEMTMPNPYEERVECIKKRGIAVWDVIALCNREGSLDSAIKNEVPNEFSTLFESYPRIRLVAFNGTKARQVYKKYIDLRVDRQLEYITLPSTSPALTKSLEEKIKAWGVIAEYL